MKKHRAFPVWILIFMFLNLAELGVHGKHGVSTNINFSVPND